jgi:hypothetical protein
VRKNSAEQQLTAESILKNVMNMSSATESSATLQLLVGQASSSSSESSPTEDSLLQLENPASRDLTAMLTSDVPPFQLDSTCENGPPNATLISDEMECSKKLAEGDNQEQKDVQTY